MNIFLVKIHYIRVFMMKNKNIKSTFTNFIITSYGAKADSHLIDLQKIM